MSPNTLVTPAARSASTAATPQRIFAIHISPNPTLHQTKNLAAKAAKNAKEIKT
jgi:hypothetical protein